MSSSSGTSPQLVASQASSPPVAASRSISQSPPEEAEQSDLGRSVLGSQSVTARPRKIPIAPVFVREAPRSPGGSTIRPVPIRLFGATEPEEKGEPEDKDHYHPGRDGLARRPCENQSQAGSTTIKPSSYAKLLHAYAQMVDQLGESQPGSLTTLGPRSFLGVGPGSLGAATVDELQVEWCILCGNPRDRQKMELRGFKPGEKGIGGESDPDGFWWFCVGPCPKPLEELNSDSRHSSTPMSIESSGILPVDWVLPATPTPPCTSHPSFSYRFCTFPEAMSAHSSSTPVEIPSGSSSSARAPITSPPIDPSKLNQTLAPIPTETSKHTSAQPSEPPLRSPEAQGSAGFGASAGTSGVSGASSAGSVDSAYLDSGTPVEPASHPTVAETGDLAKSPQDGPGPKSGQLKRVEQGGSPKRIIRLGSLGGEGLVAKPPPPGPADQVPEEVFEN